MNKIIRKVYKIDAEGQSVGRISTEIATILRGKHKPEYQPHLDMGDIVEVSNADKLKFTGKKIDQKNYYHYSGYIGGLKTKKLGEVFEKDPGEPIRRAVREMLAPTRLRKDIMKRLIIK